MMSQDHLDKCTDHGVYERQEGFKIKIIHIVLTINNHKRRSHNC